MKKKANLAHVENILRERKALKAQLRGAGPHLADLRLIKNLSQAAMAAAIGVSPSMLNRIESGERALSLPVAFTVTGVFGIPLDKLLSGWTLEELTVAHEKHTQRLTAKMLREEFPDAEEIPDDICGPWWFELRQKKITTQELSERIKSWKAKNEIPMERGADKDAPASNTILFRLDNKALVDLVNGWAAALDVTPAVLLEALLVDFFADAVVWHSAFPETPFNVPMIRRDGATNELLLGKKLLASLVESKTKFLQDGMRHTRNGLELSLRDELVVDRLIQETSGEAAVKVERKKGK